MKEGDLGRTERLYTFADVPKMELDQLVDQLVASAEGVRRTQGRLRVLLRAVDMINSDLDLDGVLEHTAEAAVQVAEARTATIGVLGSDAAFGHGVTTEVGGRPERFGPAPAPGGAVGDALGAGRPLRLVGAQARAVRLPGAGAPSDSLLAVPVRVHGDVFAPLFVCGSKNDGFSAEDEELVMLLAAAAGTAIDNARLYQESRQQQRWLRASADISAQLLAATGEDPLHTVARHVADVASADVVTVAVLTPSGGELVIEVAVGVAADDLLGTRTATSSSLAARALSAQRPFVLDAPPPAEGSAGDPARRLGAGQVMMVPLVGAAVPLGVLSIIRHRSAAPFTPQDVEMAGRFAAQAAVALELTSARADRQRVELLEDRDRIARDLHDHVIQQLFAIGLSLQGLAAIATEHAELAEPLEQRVEDIDRTIRQIRTTIFALRNPTGPASGLRGTLLAIGSELTPVLGFSPGFTFAGPVDTLVPDGVGDDVRACVREALTNVAKYAAARRAFVDVATDMKSVTVRVSDDGPGHSPDGNGALRVLAARAERRGGSFDVSVPSTGGTELVWKVPIT